MAASSFRPQVSQRLSTRDACSTDGKADPFGEDVGTLCRPTLVQDVLALLNLPETTQKSRMLPFHLLSSHADMESRAKAG